MTRLRYCEEDWDVIRDSLAAWWKQQTPAIPALSITAPRQKPLSAPPAKEPKTMLDKWMDMDCIASAFEAEAAKTFRGGLAYPYLTTYLGPGSLALFTGSEPDFAETTVWYKTCFKDPAKVDLKMLFDNPYWLWTLDATRRYLTAGQGKYLVGLPDLVEGLDILACLFGTEELLTFLVDCPDEIHRLLDQLDDIYWQAFDPIYELVKDDRNGNSFIAFRIWGPGKTVKVQCDFSAMISPDMFAEFVCPHLEKQCARADFSLYHLDGPSCIRHLKLLLELVPSLDAVQWSPGAGNPHEFAADPAWWDIIWKPVLASGRSAQVFENPSSLVEPFVREFGWNGVYISTDVNSEAEARVLLEKAATW